MKGFLPFVLLSLMLVLPVMGMTSCLPVDPGATPGGGSGGGVRCAGGRLNDCQYSVKATTHNVAFSKADSREFPFPPGFCHIVI